MVPSSQNEIINAYQRSWEECLIKVAGYEKSIPLKRKKQLRANAKKLWTIYNKERSDLRLQLLNEDQYASAYFSSFHQINFYRYLSHLEKLNLFNLLSPLNNNDIAKYKIIDLGSGCGSFALSLIIKLLSIYSSIKDSDLSIDIFKEIIFQDQSKKLTQISELLCNQFLSNFKGRPNVKKAICNISEFDISRRIEKHSNTEYFILFGYVLNELKPINSKLKKLFRFLEQNPQAKINILVCEPAKLDYFNQLINLRTTLSEMNFSTLHPCSHNLRCPLALENELNKRKDWCFSEAKNYFYKKIEEIDKEMHLDHFRFSSSFYFFSNYLDKTNQRNDRKIIIGKPDNKDSKPNTFKLLLCSKDGIEKTESIDSSIKSRFLRGTKYREENTGNIPPN